MYRSSQETLFKEWITDHKGLLLKVVRAYASRSGDEADLFQQILFHVWRGMPGFRGDSKASTWLYSEIHRLGLVDRSLTLLSLEGVSYHEMGEIMGMSESNIGVRLNRIKKQLIERREGTKHES